MNRTVVVTGASGSMGSEAVRSLAAAGDNVVMACRNIAKADKVRDEILNEVHRASIDIIRLDLSSLQSVRAFAESIAGLKVDALFNNAGVINRDFRLTDEGFENTLATNYLGPCYLTKLLLPQMTEGSRIVNMVSLTCRYGNVDDTFFQRGEDRFSQLGTYSDTKLALLLFSISLAERTPGIHVNVADPGIVNSNMISMGRWFDPLANIFFRPFCKSPKKGVTPALRALDSDSDLQYFVGGRHSDIDDAYKANPYVAWLWEETEKLLPL